MRCVMFAGLLALLWGAGLTAQQAPKILSTIPANGSQDVDLGLGRILVVFDQDMLDGAFSLVPVDGCEVPPLAGDPRYLDARTLVIALKPLESGKHYGLGLNSERRKGFQNKDNVPLAPYQLRFATKGAAAPPDPADAARVRVVRTVPVSGVEGVDPGLEAVEIFFSQPMRPQGMSLLRIAGCTPLGYRKEAMPFWKSPTHLVIPVRLEPGQAYGVAINGPDRQNFVAESGEPCAPFALRFRTAERGTPTLTAPAGRWVQAQEGGRIEQYLLPGGEWGLVRIQGEQRTHIHGTWKDEGGTLRIQPDNGRALPEQSWRLDGDALVLMTGGPVAAERRLARAPLPPLAGTWKTSWGKGNWRVHRLLPDGRFFSELTLDSIQALRRQGRWQTDGLLLVLHTDGEDGGAERYEWCIGATGMLELTADNKTQAYAAVEDSWLPIDEKPPENPLDPRTGPENPLDPRPGPRVVPPPEQPPVVGTWWVRDDTGTYAELRLLPDGRYTRVHQSGMDEARSGGTWKLADGVLLVHDEEEGEDLRVPFRLLDKDRLELTIDGERVVFRRKLEREEPKQGGGLPRELLGNWFVGDATGSIRIVLNADASFRFELDSFGNKQAFAGRASFANGTLELQDAGTQRVFRVPCARQGEKLQATLNGTQLLLERQ